MNTAQVNTGGRKQYIDFAKGIVAISVVIGHLVPFNGLVFRWIFGFHMPFFFLLYGYMQKDSMPAFGDFVRSKVKRLLIPSWCYRFVYHIVLKNRKPSRALSRRFILSDSAKHREIRV